MRKILLASAVLMTLGAPAFANGLFVQGAGVIGTFNEFTANQQGSTNSGAMSGSGSGNSTTGSASGFTGNFATSNGGKASFSSYGNASSTMSETPFSTTTTSSHDGAFTAKSWGNGSVNGTAQTFGQSTGSSTFNENFNSQHSDFSNSQSGASLKVGFVAFEGGFKSFGGTE